MFHSILNFYEKNAPSSTGSDDRPDFLVNPGARDSSSLTSENESVPSSELPSGKTDIHNNTTMKMEDPENSNETPDTEEERGSDTLSAERAVKTDTNNTESDEVESKSSNELLSAIRGHETPPESSETVTDKSAKESRKQPRKQKFPKKRVDFEILKLEHSVHLLIPRLPFQRLVREVLMNEENRQVTRITSQALEALQESSELYLTQLLSDSYLCTIHRARVTLSVNDLRLVQYLRKEN